MAREWHLDGKVFLDKLPESTHRRTEYFQMENLSCFKHALLKKCHKTALFLKVPQNCTFTPSHI
jgi:hypothetical protein